MLNKFKNHFGLNTTLIYVSQVGWNKHEFVFEIITPGYALIVTSVIDENLIRNINWVTFAQKSINQFFQDVFNTIPHKNSHEVLGLLKHHFAAEPYIPIIP